MSETDPRTTLSYRLYWINCAGGIDAVARIVDAVGDDDAIAQAADLADGDRVELWLGPRLVAQIAARAIPEMAH